MALFRCRVNHCSHFARNKELEVQMQLQIWLEIPYIPVHVSSDNKRYHRNYRNQNEGENWQNREPAQKEGSDNKAWGKTQVMSKQRGNIPTYGNDIEECDYDDVGDEIDQALQRQV